MEHAPRLFSPNLHKVKQFLNFLLHTVQFVESLFTPEVQSTVLYIVMQIKYKKLIKIKK